METVQTGALGRIFSAAKVAKLGVWYVVLLIPTLYFKHAYLDSLAEEGVFAALDARGIGPLARLARYALLFTSDFLELLLIVLALYAIGHLLLRIDLDWLIGTTVAVLLLVSAGNWLSFEVIGTLLTLDNVALAFAWTREHPEVVSADRTGILLAAATGGLIVIAALWGVMSFIFARHGVTAHSAPIVARVMTVLVAVLLLSAAVDALARSRDREPVPLAYRGYWRATAVSLAGLESWRPFERRLPGVAALDSAYRRIAYPNGDLPAERRLVEVPMEQRVPRHIVIISLETAPRKYYPILDNPLLPTFRRMADRGLSSERHYTTNPATTWATFSMLSGTYPRQGKSLLDYGDFSSDGVASVLTAHGYVTTFVDSYKVDWQAGYHREHNTRMVRELGFAQRIDVSRDSAVLAGGGGYDLAITRERRSLARTLQTIDDARQRGTHAVVFVATILGHFPWPAQPAIAPRPANEKLLGIAKAMDGLLSELLGGLDRRGLLDSTIVVVTGDHGLRAKGEFASLGEDMRFGPVSFNVPFVLYAPGLFAAPTRLPYATSHVDITPTLLELVGLRTDSLLLHGSSMLDARLRDRTIFLMNNRLRPVDGYYRDSTFFVFNSFTGEAHVERERDMEEAPGPARRIPEVRTSDSITAVIRSTLDGARRVFDQSAASQLQRRAREPH